MGGHRKPPIVATHPAAAGWASQNNRKEEQKQERLTLFLIDIFWFFNHEKQPKNLKNSP